MADKDKVVLKIDQERIRDYVKVDELLEMQEGVLKTIVEVMSNFVWNVGKGEYYSYKVGREKMGNLTLRQLNDLKQDFFGGAEETAVPKAKGSE